MDQITVLHLQQMAKYSHLELEVLAHLGTITPPIKLLQDWSNTSVRNELRLEILQLVVVTVSPLLVDQAFLTIITTVEDGHVYSWGHNGASYIQGLFGPGNKSASI